jgi:hypothetical protein
LSAFGYELIIWPSREPNSFALPSVYKQAEGKKRVTMRVLRNFTNSSELSFHNTSHLNWTPKDVRLLKPVCAEPAWKFTNHWYPEINLSYTGIENATNTKNLSIFAVRKTAVWNQADRFSHYKRIWIYILTCLVRIVKT